MANVKVCGDALVITSTLKYEEIEMVKKYRPEALTLKGGEDGKEPIFKITTGTMSEIGKYGACFDGATRDGNGFATITLMIDEEPADLREEIADKYGAALINVGTLEAILPEVLQEIEAERAAVLEQIEIS